MHEHDLTNLAIDHVRRRVGDDGPPDARIIHCEATRRWDPELLRTTSEHALHVLGRAADVVVYFDDAARVTGWRDDGRKGAELPGMVDRDALLAAVTAELGLPVVRLGRVEPRRLPPLGWTHQAVLFLAPTPAPDQIVTAWIDPGTLKVIQSLRQSGAGDAHADAAAKSNAAAQLVTDLLTRRLRRAGISTSRPEWFFQVEPTEPRPFEGGAQVRVHTWRHWSDASVTYNADDGDLLADVIDRFAAPPAEAEASRDDVLAAAERHVAVPADAEPAGFEHEPFANGHRVARIEWLRRHAGLRVDGDYLDLALHPQTGRLVSQDRKWRTLRLKPGNPRIDEQQAIATVRRQRGKLLIPPDLSIDDAEQAIVEHKRNRDQPGATQDRIAWIVTLTGPTGWAKVHVDAETGKVLAVVRSA